MNNVKRIGLVLMLFSFLSIFHVSYADPPLPTPIGRVVWVKGTLKAIMQNSEERNLQKMSVIYLHDILTTDANSQAEIAFTDESLMTFYPNTRFTIDKYTLNKSKNGTVGSYVANLVEGGFRTITGLIAKNSPSNYQVNTPVATIGVRGTDYAVMIKAGQLYVGRYNGSPCVHSKKNAELCLSDTTSYASVASAGAAPVPLSEQPAVFKEKLVVSSFTIAPFGIQGGRGGGAGGGGVTTSFCISQ
jgi:hypothetical protein